MPTVTRVHRELSANKTHEHIAEVCVGDTHYTRAQVIVGLAKKESWRTQGPDGSTAEIKPAAKCHYLGCSLTPYITTAPDHTTANNLDTLPPC